MDSLHSRKSTSKKSSSSVSKFREQTDNAFYVSDFKPILITHAQFYNEYLLLCADTIKVYNTATMTKQTEIKVKTHTATFIPFTNYIAFPDFKDEEKRELVFWDIKTDNLQASITFNFAIEDIKASRRTVTITSMEHLYVIHFPSLKPIYEGFAGNGVKVAFDTSREGLTLAHSTQRKGRVKIKNFTNIQTKKLLADIQTQSKGQTLTKVFRERQPSISSSIDSSIQREESDIKKQITLAAHNQSTLGSILDIAIIRLSPNGYRVVTSSIKGTIIRMFSCLKGELISQFRMGYDLALTVDIQFISEGTRIVCLNDKNQVHLFHARMSDLQLLSESSRKGYQIYQQKNPTSFFSFLGFINQNLKNELPFASFRLETEALEIEERKSKLQSELSQKQQAKQMGVIHEVEQKQPNQSNIHQDKSNEEGKSLHQESGQEHRISVSSPRRDQIKMEQVIQGVPLQGVQASSNQKMQDVKEKSLKSHFKSLKINSSLKVRAKSLTSLGKHNKKTQYIRFGEQQKSLYIKGVINFGTQTNVKVLQGKYLFQLKYDPFNGGHMVEKSIINLLKHDLFSDL